MIAPVVEVPAEQGVYGEATEGDFHACACPEADVVIGRAVVLESRLKITVKNLMVINGVQTRLDAYCIIEIIIIAGIDSGAPKAAGGPVFPPSPCTHAQLCATTR